MKDTRYMTSDIGHTKVGSVIYEPKGRAREYAALALNHYIGCDHHCDYCYGPQLLHITREDFGRARAKPNVIERLIRDAGRYAGGKRRLLLSFTCDPYQLLNEQIGLTREVIEVLKRFAIPFEVLSKGGTRACSDFDLYDDMDAFGTTMTFASDGKSLAREPNAAVPWDRIEAIKTAHNMGISTYVCLEPVLDVEEVWSIIAKTHKYVDRYKVGKLNYQPSEIDWAKFTTDVVHCLRALRKDFYIKKSLQEFMK